MRRAAGRARDERLERRAEAHLPVSGPDVAGDALASGVLLRADEHTSWEGTLGRMRGVRVVLVVPTEHAARLAASPSSVDVLTRAVAGGVAETPGEVLADFSIEVGEVPGKGGAAGGPYRST